MSPRLSRTISVALTLPAVWSIEWLCKPWPLRHRHSLECLALQAPLCLPSGIGTHLSAWPVRHPFVCPSGSGTHLSVWHFWHPLLALQAEPFRQQYPLGYLALQAYRVLLSLSPLTRSVGQERNFKLLGAVRGDVGVGSSSLCPRGGLLEAGTPQPRFAADALGGSRNRLVGRARVGISGDEDSVDESEREPSASACERDVGVA